MTTRVAVLGAGPSGLSAIRAFESERRKGGEVPEVVCFEKQPEVGGLWIYDWRTGIDHNGEPVHASMYRYLWSNGPKEALEFADYTFDEHFGKEIASYPPREVLFDYIKGRIAKTVATEWIRLNTAVRSVVWDAGRETFSVTVHDYVNHHTYTEDFDYIVNATGHFSTPNVPYFEGIEKFAGSVVHAHDFRDALAYKDKDILIVGASYSAEDIGSQCWKYGCKSVTLSYRTASPGYTWPDNWEEKPLLTKIKGRTCHFIDGTSRDLDAIILCTGYLHHYPWFDDDHRLESANRMWTLNLYQGVAWTKNPRLFYIGAQDQWFTFNMFDAMGWWARDVILGRIELPDQATMDADCREWREKEEAATGDPDIQRQWIYQGETVKRLITQTDYPSFDVDGVHDLFYQWKKHKQASIMGFRDNSYRSVMTGKTSPAHHTPWVDALDDSIGSYLKTGG